MRTNRNAVRLFGAALRFPQARANYMIACDLAIYRTAQVVIDGHGDIAHHLANGRREDCLDRSDQHDAEEWLRIIAAIEFLSAEKAEPQVH